jgi:hypothetical protein
MKMPKLPKSVSKLLENKYVLYFVLFLAVTNVIGYLLLGNLTAIVFFILIGYLVYNFSKNMIVVLSVPLILTNLFMIGKNVKEGLENSSKNDDTKNDDTKSDTKNDDKKEEKKEEKSVTLVSSTPKLDSEHIITTNVPTGESMTNMGKGKNRIDYAATVEDAYDDLNKILGGDGIKRLTDDTQKLMSQQMQLADAMKNMSPLLEQAKSMLKGFDFKNLDGIAGLAKSFGMGS